MKKKLKCVSDYILIRPDKPEGGKFDVGDMYIDEHGIVEDVGAKTSDEMKKLVGARVIFNAWACDKKRVEGKDYYFALESANAICAII